MLEEPHKAAVPSERGGVAGGEMQGAEVQGTRLGNAVCGHAGFCPEL